MATTSVRKSRPSGVARRSPAATLPGVNPPNGASPEASGRCRRDLRRRPEARRRLPRHHGLGDGVASRGPTARRRWTLVAPDLRGRGAAAEFGGRYGPPATSRMLRDREVPSVESGRRGGAVSGTAWARTSRCWPQPPSPGYRKLVLVDGGLPFPPPPEGVSVDDMLKATLAGDRRAEHDLRVRAGLPRLLPRPSRADRRLERRHRGLRAVRPHRGAGQDALTGRRRRRP